MNKMENKTYKKILFLILSIMTFTFLTACSSKPGVESKTTSGKPTKIKEIDSKKEEVKKELNTQTIDGLTLTVASKIEAIKGDRTKDDVGKENGEYIADGSDVVKAIDYKKIAISVNVKNNTDRTIPMSAFYWGAELQDGYKLNQTITGNQKDSQIQSKTNGKYEFYYTVKKDIKADKINLTYLWVKNEEEFKKIMADPNLSKMSEKEAKEKYKNVYTGFKLVADIQK